MTQTKNTTLTSFSSVSSLHGVVYGRAWLSIQSFSWLSLSAHEPHGPLFSSSSHGNPSDNHSVYGVTLYTRSAAVKSKEMVKT